MTNPHGTAGLRWLVMILLCGCGGASGADEVPPQVSVASFSSASSQQVFKHWQSYRFSLFGASTHYQLAQQNGHQVLQAVSKKTASGLIHNLTVSLTDHPILHWRWKITKLPTNADDHSKQGDDHSARLYVIFEAPQVSLLGWLKNATGLERTHALSYIWANQAPANTLLASPYTERSMMIAANSGRSQIGQWVSLSRNVAADYQRAFGTSPPPVSAIAIMTDGDNTDSLLTSYYGDIYFARTQLSATSQQAPLAQPATNPLP
ncbi:MAG: DUF3047 domain-containing protein [Pseudomonadales bacterium]